MQTPGTYISAVGHVGLIGWLLLGWGFDAEPLPFEVTEVSVVTGEEFERMMAARAPDPGEAEPTAPVPPVVDDTPPPQPAQEQPTEVSPPPEPVEPPADEVPPVAPPAPAAPPPTPEIDVSPTPTPPQADRIASTPSAPPPPDAQVADVTQSETVPDDAADPEIVEDPAEATAPPEAATEIAIADEVPSGAVEASQRPQARPSRPTPPVEPDTQTAEVEPTPEPDAPAVEDESVEAALAAALGATEAPAAAVGPPMTGSERDSFRVAVNRCWNVDPGSVAARVVVEVGFDLDRAGKVQGDVRLISSDGDQSATNTAFEAARRAILRCQSGGYQLPADKYDHWKEVVITFDPSGMRLR